MLKIIKKGETIIFMSILILFDMDVLMIAK